MQEFASTLTVLSAIITPAILILASGQLILTTSQRLARSLDRARKLSEGMEKLMDDQNSSTSNQKIELMISLMQKTAKRASLLQRALSVLYIAISTFVLTSVSIGLLEVFDILVAWVPVAFGLVGVTLLFHATVLLIMETKMARDSVNKEMAYLLNKWNLK